MAQPIDWPGARMEQVKLDRRNFLRLAGAAGATAVVGRGAEAQARQYQPPPQALGCLVDLSHSMNLSYGMRNDTAQNRIMLF